MKRILSVLLTAAMLVSLTSCLKKANNKDIPVTEISAATDIPSEISKTVSVDSSTDAEPLPDTHGETSPNSQNAITDTTPPPSTDSISDEPPKEYIPVTDQPETAVSGNYKPYKFPGNLQLYENMQIDPNRQSYDMGICRKLEGNIDVYLFFMDDDESSWNSDCASSFIDNAINPALSYIQHEAQQWGKTLRFNTPEVYVTGGDKGFTMKYNGTVTADWDDMLTNGPQDILVQAAKCIGYSDEYEMFNHYRDETARDNAVYLTLFNKDGRSYSLLQSNTKSGMYAEHCVLFSMTEYDFRSSCIAHEILHLYGAEDYYLGSREPIAAEIYPNDIMFQIYDDVNLHKLGDYTAFTIGWTDLIPDVCSRKGWYD